MTRTLLISLLLQSAALCAAAQPKYKDIYEAVKTMKDYEAFQTLFHYQSATTSKEFVNVNGYYQMGLIAQKMMRQYDPFLQSQNTAQCISEATVYLSLALHYFDEREAKRNGAYYQGASGERTYDNIKNDMETRLADIAEYKKQFEQNLDYLTGGIRRYNACIETFGNINEQNSRLNDLYFLADDALKKNLADLKANFDATLHYLEKLKASLEAYPMADYHINYALSPIAEYRLHGLTAANFIAKEANLWDFGSWVDAFDSVWHTDVAFLYRKVDEIYQTNMEHIARLQRPGTTDAPPDGEYLVDPAVINKIYRYDFNSAVAPLLKYQEEKINLLRHHAGNIVDHRLTARYRFAKSPDYYFDLIARKQAADSALRLIADKATPEALKKYRTFFTARYKSFDGFKAYRNSEATENDLFLHAALDAYKNNVLAAAETGTADSTEYKNEPFYTAPAADMPDKTGTSGYFIHAKTMLPNKKIFVTGSYVNKQAESIAFAALLSDNAAIEWLKLLDKKAAKNRGMLAAAADNGFAVVVTAGNEPETANYLYLIDPAGTVKKNIKLAATATPRKIIYDDISETLLLAFKGASFLPCESSSDALQLYKLHADLSGEWNTEVPFTGYLSNIIKTNDRLYIYGACSEPAGATGKRIAADGKKVNAFVAVIDADGKQSAMRVFDAPFSYYPLYISKISNEYVDMIAVKETLPSDSAASNSPSYYLILSADNEIYYRY
ncbi:MAG: hypothetical protein LBI89_03215 [Prevotellaceae bacterium]|jgi:hypothetical protein|nr:hypothetical protein [Prevotellaceae bacterium]